MSNVTTQKNSKIRKANPSTGGNGKGVYGPLSEGSSRLEYVANLIWKRKMLLTALMMTQNTSDNSHKHFIAESAIGIT